MNILQVITSLDKNGASEDTISSTRFLTLSGHKAIVLCQKSVFVKKIDELGARYFPVSLKPNVFLIPQAIFKIFKIIMKENVDVIHARDGISSFCAFFASRLTGKPFVSTVYSDNLKGLFTRAQFWAKRIIFPDHLRARYFIEKGVIPQNKAFVIPPSVEPAIKHNPKSEKLKGHYIIVAELPLSIHEDVGNFIKAIAIFYRTVYKLKVYIIEKHAKLEKNNKEAVKLLIKRHALTDIVEFFPEGQDIKSFMRPDLFMQIQNKKIDSTRPLFYYQAMEVPVLTTSCEQLKNYKDSKGTTVEVDIKNVSKMSSKIIELYKNVSLREEIVKKALDFIRDNFNTRKIMDSTLKIYKEATSSTNILVIKLGALGDTILVTPSLRAIRERFPGARIKLLVGIENREVFTNSPLIDELIVCDLKNRDRGFRGILRVAKKLRSEGFDITIDFQNNKKSHLLSYLSCASKRYGYDNGKLSFLINRKIKDSKIPEGPVSHQEKLLGLLGMYNIEKKLELWPTKEDEEWAQNFLESHWVKSNTKVIAINIDSSKRWITKLWPIEHFVKLCNILAKEFNIRILLIGKDKETPRANKFFKLTKSKPINALGKTNIPRLASLIKRCSLLLTSDSAPLHVAAAMGTPFIALFGPTDPRRHVPTAKKKTIIKKDLPCIPCYHTHCDRGYICMRSIDPEEVTQAVLDILGIKEKVS